MPQTLNDSKDGVLWAQEALRRLHEEEDVKDAMVNELEAARVAAVMAKKSSIDVMKVHLQSS